MVAFTDLPGTVMVAFTAMASQLMVDMAMVDTMARGLLMLSPRLRLMPGTDMVAFTDTASQPMADMAMVVTTARGLLMLSPRLMLMPGTVMVAFTAMVGTTARSKILSQLLAQKYTPKKYSSFE